MKRLKSMVAMMLALVWLPAVSCCLIDASDLLNKRDCCAKERSQPVPEPGHCSKPCGTLASASYFPPQDEWAAPAPIGIPLFNAEFFSFARQHLSDDLTRRLPATAPPELAKCWQFSRRAASPPRAPSPVS